MKPSDLPKTHYQIVKEYFASIGADLEKLLEKITKDYGEDPCFEDVYKCFTIRGRRQADEDYEL